jgi:hypothetical protein
VRSSSACPTPAEPKVRDGTYDIWIRQITDQASQHGVSQTPTLLVADRQVDTACTPRASRQPSTPLSPDSQAVHTWKKRREKT